jgi:tripartite ATP-independent transporter DctP family solute receptor
MLMALSNGAEAAKQLRVGMVMTPDHPHVIAMNKFGDLVKAKTNGSVEIKVFPNSQLGNAIAQIQSVKMGTLEAFMDGAGWYGQLVGDYYIFATPYLMKDIEHTRRVAASPIADEINAKLIEKHGMRMLTLGWLRLPRDVISKKPIKSLADVQGLKMRVPELTSFSEGWRALGASPTPVAYSEIYLGLQQGVVESAELSMDMFYNIKLYEVAKYIALTQHQAEPGAMIINDRFYKGLTPGEQKAIGEALKEAGALNDELIRKDQDRIVAAMKAAGVTFSEVNRAEFREKAKNLPYALEEKGVWTKGLYDKVKKID